MASNNKGRLKIPEAVKREVRQRCGFGCVICGTPFFQYDHIRPYSVRREHMQDNITLLCPGHHQAKTSGVLPTAIVVEANARPFNRNSAYTSKDTLASHGSVSEIRLGNVIFSFDFGKYPEREGFAAIAINGTTLVGAYHEEGNLLLFMYGADSSGRDLFVVERGELVVSTATLDFHREGKRFVIREKNGRVALDFLKTDNGFIINVGRVCHANRSVSIDSDGVMILPQRGRVSAIQFTDCYCAISVGEPKVGQLALP